MTRASEIHKLSEDISAQLHHYYVGVEHLFLALVDINGSIVADILRQHGQVPTMLAYQLTEHLGQSPHQRYWEGFRRTPRLENVLALARKLSDAENVDDRILFLAILQEGDSLPTRALQDFGLDLSALAESVQSGIPQLASDEQHKIDTAMPLSQQEKSLLRSLFQEDIYIKSEVGQSISHRYLVQTAESYEVVKFDQPEAILREKYRYETRLKGKLPPEASPITGFNAQEHLGGLRYSLGQSRVQTLGEYAKTKDLPGMNWLIRHSLHEGCKTHFWGSGKRHLVSLWREYEFLLPPALVIEYSRVDTQKTLRPLNDWSYGEEIPIESAVALEGFTIERVLPHRNSVWLCAGRGDEAVNYSARVVITGMSENRLSRYVPGQDAGRIKGIVRQTRGSLLRTALEQTSPPFALDAQTLPDGRPNPLLSLPALLSYEIEAYLSLIHGNLTLDNILVDEGEHIHLIDYSQTRIGHSLFDWASLEFSIWRDLLLPMLPSQGWEQITEAVAVLQALNDQDNNILSLQTPITVGVSALATVRSAAAQLLAAYGRWEEYFGALALVSLSATTVPHPPTRRLGFAMSAVMTDAFLTRIPS
jgi:hypothetical protein